MYIWGFFIYWGADHRLSGAETHYCPFLYALALQKDGDSVYLFNDEPVGGSRPRSLTMMLTPQYKFDSNSADGLGLFIDTWNHKKLVSHSGSDVGYSSYVGMIPEDSVGIVFMSNLHRFVPYETLTYL